MMNYQPKTSCITKSKNSLNLRCILFTNLDPPQRNSCCPALVLQRAAERLNFLRCLLFITSTTRPYGKATVTRTRGPLLSMSHPGCSIGILILVIQLGGPLLYTKLNNLCAFFQCSFRVFNKIFRGCGKWRGNI